MDTIRVSSEHELRVQGKVPKTTHQCVEWTRLLSWRYTTVCYFRYRLWTRKNVLAEHVYVCECTLFLQICKIYVYDIISSSMTLLAMLLSSKSANLRFHHTRNGGTWVRGFKFSDMESWPLPETYQFRSLMGLGGWVLGHFGDGLNARFLIGMIFVRYLCPNT